MAATSKKLFQIGQNPSKVPRIALNCPQSALTRPQLRQLCPERATMRPRGRDMIIWLIVSFFDMIWSNFKKLLDIKAKLWYNMYYNGRIRTLRNGADLHLGARPLRCRLALTSAPCAFFTGVKKPRCGRGLVHLILSSRWQ